MSFLSPSPLRNDRSNRLHFLAGLLLFGILLASARISTGAEKASGPASNATKGQTFFVQFSLFQEKGVHKTTNYRKGMLVPVNTEVTFVKADKRDIVVKLPDGTSLTLANVENFSGEKVDGIFTRTLGSTKVNLDKFSEAERKAILAGRVEPGMTKAAVVVAIGYPPKHKTPSLVGDHWRYWQNKFNTFLVHFQDDKVSEVQN